MDPPTSRLIGDGYRGKRGDRRQYGSGVWRHSDLHLARVLEVGATRGIDDHADYATGNDVAERGALEFWRFCHRCRLIAGMLAEDGKIILALIEVDATRCRIDLPDV
jgi:hypothetical protein